MSDPPAAMRRIAVIGCAGAGKTTLANALGTTLDLPVVHLDERYWNPGWVPTETSEWLNIQRDLAAGDRWIIDGSYTSTLEPRLRRADTVIVLAFPRWRCLLGVVRRWARHRGHAIQAPGCPERADLAFLLWIWRYPRRSAVRQAEALAQYAGDARVIELGGPRQVREFLEGVPRAG